MKKQFLEDDLETDEQFNINSSIMEQASDIAEKVTDLECSLHGIECYVTVMENGTEVSTYTEEAQEIFNVYYDEYKTELYNLLNRQLKIIE